MHSVSTFLCVYVWSDLSCDLSVIEGSGAAHMGSRHTVLIISPRDISGSSVLQCCRHASGPRTRGKVSPWTRSGHVLAWTEIIIWRPSGPQQEGGTPGVMPAWIRAAFCCDDFALWSRQHKGRGHRVAGSPVALWGTCCPNILIFWILDYRFLN